MLQKLSPQLNKILEQLVDILPELFNLQRVTRESYEGMSSEELDVLKSLCKSNISRFDGPPVLAGARGLEGDVGAIAQAIMMAITSTERFAVLGYDRNGHEYGTLSTLIRGRAFEACLEILNK